ncbi:uncharacterized protein LACBIDRAFT_308692 [Laccaria bicolor S238N-H82]|uniref:Predicted protein n=1 Tax=Laccaria bicolor (strain S238N-H82 / ATCC MYA-4686) TaxID=486041 RepID=B0CWY7_LACBS|nr:uncharacterized protein LACBIDRAFT_308692 [Laccaria bicolor S238N-H82]EDR13590.1 predicted protein [Laccaria bicolor S238N-H82]|eukprot:XP_001876088.1 predicted protein [Laccaria bicolor S238N-H82]
MQTEHSFRPTFVFYAWYATKFKCISAPPPPTRSQLTSQSSPIPFYPPALNLSEKIWHDRYYCLLHKGSQLCPRYRRGWTPSGSMIKAKYRYARIHCNIFDGCQKNRTRGGLAVCLKAVFRTPKEAEIAKYLLSPELLQEPPNHSVPILDVFQDPSAPDSEYLVIPLLCPFDDPEFAIDEVVDFVTQVLEGLTFMLLIM